MGGSVAHGPFGSAREHDLAAGVAALRAQVDQPVAGADHVEVVLDHHQRMADRDEAAEGGEELGHVVEVQARGGLVEQEEARPRRRDAGMEGGGDAVGGAPGSIATGLPEASTEMARELQALGLAAGQRGHRLSRRR